MTIEDKIKVCDQVTNLINEIEKDGDWYFADLITNAIQSKDTIQLQVVKEALTHSIR